MRGRWLLATAILLGMAASGCREYKRAPGTAVWKDERIRGSQGFGPGSSIV